MDCSIPLRVFLINDDSFAGVVARVKSLPLAALGDFVRGRMPPSGMISEGERQVEGLFESLLSQSFG